MGELVQQTLLTIVQSQHLDGVEFEAIEVELDRAPVMSGDQAAEIIGQLGFEQIVDAVHEIRAHAPDGASIGIDGLGL